MINKIRIIYLNNKKTLANTFWQFIQISGKQLFILGVFFISAWLLNSYDFGIYNYSVAILMLLVLFGDFGVSTATSKYVAEYNETNKDKLKYLSFSTLVFVGSILILLSLLLLIFGPSLLGKEFIFVKNLIPSLIFLPLTYIYTGIYRGLKLFKKLSIITAFTGIIGLIISLPLIYFWGLFGALWANNVFSIIFFLAILIGYWPREWKIKVDLSVIRNISKYSIILGVISLSYFVYSRVDVILLGHFGYISEIGFYELINKIFLILVSPFMIFAQVISPDITGLYASGRVSEIYKKFKQYFTLIFVISIILTIASYLLVPFILKYILIKYQAVIFFNAFYVMLIMLITQAVAAVVSVGFSVATGHAKINMYFLLIFGILNIPFTYMLISKFGFMGGVYATVGIRCLTDILFISYYYFLLKKNAQKI